MFDAGIPIPGWLLAGLVLGGVASIVIAVVFTVGRRVFPDPDPEARGDQAMGDSRRRAEIRAYLEHLGEAFVENERLEGQAVAFYLPDRDVAITFDAHHHFVLDRAGVDSVLVEYEMPGGHLGHRLPFDTPTVTSTPPDSAAADPAVVAAFNTLGVSPTADDAAVRAAYRERIKAAHPDHGGDQETFEEIREAYTVAKESVG